MTDIVKRAREGLCEPNVVCPDCDMLREACDEIERLREAIRMMVRLDKCASPDVYRIAREALGDD